MALILPFFGSLAANDPNVVFDVQCVGDGVAIKGDSVGGGTAIQASGGSDPAGYGGVALDAVSIAGGTAVQARNDGVDRDGNAGYAVEAISKQGGVAVIARTTGTDHTLTDQVGPDLSPIWGNPGVGVDSSCDSGGIGIRGQSSGQDNAGRSGPGIVGASEYGVGVRAASTHNYAIEADGDAVQTRGNGGWVKALVYISSDKSSSKISRWFSSQSSVPPTLYKLDNGLYSIDFHFKVDDRYVVVTPIEGNYQEKNPFAPPWYPPSSGSVSETRFLVANIVFDGFRSPPSYGTPLPPQRQPETTMITVMTFQPVFQSGGGGTLPFQGFQLQDASVCVVVF